MNRLSTILSEEGLKVASSYADLVKVLDQLGDVKKIKYNPASGMLDATIEMDRKLYSLEGILGRDGTLAYKATLLTQSTVEGEVFIPYEDHEEAAAEMRTKIRFH